MLPTFGVGKWEEAFQSDEEVFTKSEQLSALGRSACVGIREGRVKPLDENECVSEKKKVFHRVNNIVLLLLTAISSLFVSLCTSYIYIYIS